MSSVMKTYGRIGLTFIRGEGPWLFTEDGSKYLDFASGIAVNTFGHSDADLVLALTKQAKELIGLQAKKRRTRPQIYITSNLRKNWRT